MKYNTINKQKQKERVKTDFIVSLLILKFNTEYDTSYFVFSSTELCHLEVKVLYCINNYECNVLLTNVRTHPEENREKWPNGFNRT